MRPLTRDQISGFTQWFLMDIVFPMFFTLAVLFLGVALIVGLVEIIL